MYMHASVVLLNTTFAVMNDFAGGPCNRGDWSSQTKVFELPVWLYTCTFNYSQKQYLKHPELFLFPFYNIFTARK